MQGLGISLAGRFRVPAKTAWIAPRDARMLPEFGRDVQIFWSPCMAALVLLHCQYCRGQFVLCRACYRNHKYCGGPCRDAARRESIRAANRRFRQSPEGRLDHQDRMRACRARKKAQGQVVMDHTIASIGTGRVARSDRKTPGTSPGMTARLLVAIAQDPTKEDYHADSSPLHLACRSCGFACDFLTPAAWIYDGRSRSWRPP